MPRRRPRLEVGPGLVEHRRTFESRDQRRRPNDADAYIDQVWRVTCSCGWRSKWQPSRGDAAARADGHTVDGQIAADWQVSDAGT